MAGNLCSFMPLSLPPLAYKRSPGDPLPRHTSSQASSPSLLFHRVQRSSIFSACQFCPATEALVHMPFSDDLAIKTLPTFSSRCAYVSPTTYPKIAVRGDTIHPGSVLQWPLPRVYTCSVRMAGILVLVLPYSDIYLMHQLHLIVFPDVLYVSAEALSKI